MLRLLVPKATASGLAPPPPKRRSGGKEATEEDLKGFPAEPLAAYNFVFMLTFGLQSEAEMEGGQRIPRKEDVFEALTSFH